MDFPFFSAESGSKRGKGTGIQREKGTIRQTMFRRILPGAQIYRRGFLDTINQKVPDQSEREENGRYFQRQRNPGRPGFFHLFGFSLSDAMQDILQSGFRIRFRTSKLPGIAVGFKLLPVFFLRGNPVFYLLLFRCAELTAQVSGKDIRINMFKFQVHFIIRQSISIKHLFLPQKKAAARPGEDIYP